jgi:hypothetical protein
MGPRLAKCRRGAFLKGHWRAPHEKDKYRAVRSRSVSAAPGHLFKKSRIIATAVAFAGKRSPPSKTGNFTVRGYTVVGRTRAVIRFEVVRRARQ